MQLTLPGSSRTDRYVLFRGGILWPAKLFNEYLKMDRIVTSRFRVLTETLKLFSERMLSERDFELLDPLYSENLPE